MSDTPKTDAQRLFGHMQEAAKMHESIWASLNIGPENVSVYNPMEWIQKVGVTLLIAENDRLKPKKKGGNPNWSGNKPKAEMAPYPCPSCGSEKVFDNRKTKTGNQADFRCGNRDGCDVGKGWPWSGYLKQRDGRVFSVEELFEVNSVSEVFSNQAVEAGGPPQWDEPPIGDYDG